MRTCGQFQKSVFQRLGIPSVPYFGLFFPLPPRRRSLSNARSTCVVVAKCASESARRFLREQQYKFTMAWQIEWWKLVLPASLQLFQLLLEKKTDTEACNQKGRTAPSLAAASSAELVSLKIQLSNLIKSTSYCAVRIMLEKGEADRRKARLAHIINEAMKLLSKMPSKGKNESA